MAASSDGDGPAAEGPAIELFERASAFARSGLKVSLQSCCPAQVAVLHRELVWQQLLIAGLLADLSPWPAFCLRLRAILQRARMPSQRHRVVFFVG